MTYRVRNLGLAVALALVAALLVTFYVTNYKRNVQNGEEDVTVLVATRDIPAGTPASQVGAALAPKTLERRHRVPGAISKPEQIKSYVSSEKILAGEQVSVRRFSNVGEVGVRGSLKGNLRAIQIAGDAHQLLAGTLKRGDRVDVVGNFKLRQKENDQPITRVVLRDLLVLRAPNEAIASAKLTSVDTAFVQLAVTDAQAQKLFFTIQNGEWSLDLRPVADPADSPESLETYQTVLCDGMGRKRNSYCQAPGKGKRR
jgi:pilus assembly protein CpaB